MESAASTPGSASAAAVDEAAGFASTTRSRARESRSVWSAAGTITPCARAACRTTRPWWWISRRDGVRRAGLRAFAPVLDSRGGSPAGPAPGPSRERPPGGLSRHRGVDSGLSRAQGARCCRPAPPCPRLEADSAEDVARAVRPADALPDAARVLDHAHRARAVAGSPHSTRRGGADARRVLRGGGRGRGGMDGVRARAPAGAPGRAPRGSDARPRVGRVAYGRARSGTPLGHLDRLVGPRHDGVARPDGLALQ